MLHERNGREEEDVEVEMEAKLQVPWPLQEHVAFRAMAAATTAEPADDATQSELESPGSP